MRASVRERHSYSERVYVRRVFVYVMCVACCIMLMDLMRVVLNVHLRRACLLQVGIQHVDVYPASVVSRGPESIRWSQC
jgi:hypothetical protein